MLYFSESAKEWLCIILEERFGCEFIIEYQEDKLILRLKNDIQGMIIFPRLISEFQQFNSNILCTQWDAEKEGWDSILSTCLIVPGEEFLPNPLINIVNNIATINYDILGLIYWMFNRIEEINYTDLDNHQRFAAIHSHAFNYNYLTRPIVDEWFHILKQVIEIIWPTLELKKHKFTMKVSHDVDRPSRYGFASFSSLIRSICGDILKYRSTSSIIQGPLIRLNTKSKLHEADIYNTFDWLMDISEVNNIKSAFYFICGRTDNTKDAAYEPEHAAIRELMNRIHARGHEIGLHPSYNTYQNESLIKKEFCRLKEICKSEDIKQSEWGGRMHYLRWEHPNTLQAWNDAGLTYDSTLGYADHPGFRCGTCFEYPAFNPVTQQKLNLRIRPLIVMEVSIMSPVYLGLRQGEKALKYFLELKNVCRKVNGNFTLLWHNSELDTNSKKQLYKQVIEQ